MLTPAGAQLAAIGAARRRVPVRGDDGVSELSGGRGLARLELRRREAVRRRADVGAQVVAGGALPSSLDTSGTSGTHPPAPTPVTRELFEESPAELAFRRAVAARLKAKWHSRAKSLRNCGRAGALLACRGCKGVTAVPFRCGSRTCPTCARVAAAIMSERVRRMVAEVARLAAARPFGNRAKWDPRIHYTCPRHVDDRHWSALDGSPACECWKSRYWSMLTLTTCAGDDSRRWNPDELQLRARIVRRAFRIFWRSTEWGRQVNVRVPVHAEASRWPREWDGLEDRKVKGSQVHTKRGKPATKRVKRSRGDTGFVMAVEVSPTGMVHVHALVLGEFTLKSHLSELWAAAMRQAYAVEEWHPDAPELRRDRLVIDIRRVVSKKAGAGEVSLGDAVGEVVKYATKGSVGPDGEEHLPSPRKAAAVELALRGLRRVEYGGVFRQVANAWSDDVSRRALAMEQAKECQGCGCVGEWMHLRCCKPSHVRELGGFGYLPARLRQPPPGPEVCPGASKPAAVRTATGSTPAASSV